ncbi:sensor histidine kinase [Paenibacillus sp. OSY-SE]|uniref:sensor histidine kinase n=1 Tax=Paenibacillus sp. OSY-SE TaxID=1196323 RepID=UPI00031F78EA|nr:sensor histidine kinase [Paenibacillus sp. OSY-SE]
MLHQVKIGLRYGLLVIPVLASVYVESYSSYGIYTLCALLLLAWGELRNFAQKEYLVWTFFVVEIGYLTWFGHHYAGLLFLAFGSTVASHPVQWSDRKHAVALALAMCGLNGSLAGRPWEWVLMGNIVVITIGVLMLGIYASERAHRGMERLNDDLRQQAYELNEARMEMMQYARRVEHAAQAEERNRIAHDLHDELGHKLIRLKLMMDAAEQVKAVDSDRAFGLYDSVREQLTASMELLRMTVRRMKPSEGDVRTYSLERLVREAESGGVLRVRHQVNGIPYALYPSIEVVIYQNAQEAITNALRHGGATEVDIYVSYHPEEVVLQVGNNGSKPELPLERGIGLRGMEERTNMIGGRVEWTAEPHFTVRTVIPAAAKNVSCSSSR